jgi:hypothetical protein
MGVPVERFDPFKDVDTSALPEDDRRLVEAAPHEFAVPFGLAVAGFGAKDVPVSFPLQVLPESTRRRREFAKKGVFAVAAGVVALLVLPVLWWARTAAAESVEKQSAVIKRADADTKQKDAELRKQLARLQEAREKHRRLAMVAAPGVLFADAVSVLSRNLRERPEVWLEETTLEVADPSRSFRLLHPASGTKGGFDEREHGFVERQARVKVVGRVSPGQSPDKVFLDFVNGCRQNDLDLAVETRKTFAARDGRFEIAFLRGVELKPVGGQAVPPWTIRRPRLETDANGEPVAVKGLDVEGFETTIKRDDVAPESWKAMLEAVPKPAAPAEGNG